MYHFLSQVHSSDHRWQSTDNKEPGWRWSLRNSIFHFIISGFICIYFHSLIVLILNLFPYRYFVVSFPFPCERLTCKQKQTIYTITEKILQKLSAVRLHALGAGWLKNSDMDLGSCFCFCTWCCRVKWVHSSCSMFHQSGPDWKVWSYIWVLYIYNR